MIMSGRGLVRVGDLHVVARADVAEIAKSQVVIISGGGSGHEPAHAGFIGDGMLSGAVLVSCATAPARAPARAPAQAPAQALA